MRTPSWDRVAAFIAGLGVRRTGLMLFLGLGLAAVGLAGTLSLHIDPDLKALLPDDNVGIRTLGITAALGTALGLIGAIVTTPALLHLIGRLAPPHPPRHRQG